MIINKKSAKYRVIPKNERRFYTESELENSAEFQNKWLFLIKPEFTKSRGLIRAIVGVVASNPYDGLDTGIYRELVEESAGLTADFDLRVDDDDLY